MRILIVEDAAYMAATFKQLLPDHEVVCVSHFLQLDPLFAVKMDGSYVILQKPFDVALVDGSCGTEFEGPAIAAALSARGVACIGISVDSDLNADMLTAGAKLAFTKNVALRAFFAKAVPVEGLQNATVELQQSLIARFTDHDTDGPDTKRIEEILRENWSATKAAQARTRQAKQGSSL